MPIVVKREIEGFILNRLQAVLLSEAFRLVEQGYVTPQDFDHTLKNGLGLRWSFMGPFETIELNAPAAFRTTAAATGESERAEHGRTRHLSQPRTSSVILAQWAAQAGQPSELPRACAGATAALPPSGRISVRNRLTDGWASARAREYREDYRTGVGI